VVDQDVHIGHLPDEDGEHLGKRTPLRGRFPRSSR
jgi:hypothetical protein